ncbi:MAG: long-chain fatty acid--CoA ligase [Candidatus Pelagadaptatus aseana]|uniref:acyl-CoA synthetase n=1 Tax=Candidatus Pelagadaptatus aseana TaxID=3120508 RepID=UPI0039B33444
MHNPQVDYNIAGSVLKRAQLDPGKRAIIFESTQRSYAELSERVCKLAQNLRDHGVCVGDRVAYVGLNHPAFLETMLAAQSLGAIFVPLNFRLTGEELTFIINDAGVNTLVADDALAAVIDPVRADLCCTRYIGSESAEGDWESLEALISASEPLTSFIQTQQDDVAIIMYTSGTTGRPKGAMLTHGNLMWNNIQAAFALPALASDVSLVCAPLFHVGGLNVTTMSCLQAGGCLLLHRSFDPAATLSDVAQHKVTTMFAAPAMLLFMAQQPEFADTELSSLRMIVVGAAPVPKSLLAVFNERHIPLNQGYGLTETSPLVSFLMSEYTEAKLGSAGKPGLFGEIRVADASGDSVAAGEVGEILYRGPNVMKGYWNRPEATAEAIDEKGWFHTGDAGYLDEDGFLFISDRVKDMVISGGENVYPAEVESVLFEHPAIAEVAIIGLPDDKWGEAVTAVAALNPEASLTLDELRDFADGKLARYKLPLRLHLVEALPRNPAGKVLKFKLREELA